jgi:hypothetical protein
MGRKRRPTGGFALEYAWDHERVSVLLLTTAIGKIEHKLALYEAAGVNADIAPTIEAIKAAVDLAKNINEET